MKIGLILSSNIWYAPYLKIYTTLLDENNINYDVISWNRDGRDDIMPFQFSYKLPYSTGIIKKIYGIILYINFIKRIIKLCNYDKLVIFGQTTAIGLFLCLHYKYKKNFIVDFRDISIDRNPVVFIILKYLFKDSMAVSISSPAYINYLPVNANYLLSHNFDYRRLSNALTQSNFNPIRKSFPYRISTIGGIRNAESSITLIDEFANSQKYEIFFNGDGVSIPILKQYVETNSINNVFFTGYYSQEDEVSYFLMADVVNIFLPNTVFFSTAMSNRLYNALMYKRPVIVNRNSIQGKYVEKYKVGLVIDDCEKLSNKVENYLKSLDYEEFTSRCSELLLVFKNDYEIFKNQFLSLILENK